MTCSSSDDRSSIIEYATKKKAQNKVIKVHYEEEYFLSVIKGSLEHDVAKNMLLNNLLMSITQDMSKYAETIETHWAKFV